jgi:hypothetical protein
MKMACYCTFWRNLLYKMVLTDMIMCRIDTVSGVNPGGSIIASAYICGKKMICP